MSKRRGDRYMRQVMFRSALAVGFGVVVGLALLFALWLVFNP